MGRVVFARVEIIRPRIQIDPGQGVAVRGLKGRRRNRSLRRIEGERFSFRNADGLKRLGKGQAFQQSWLRDDGYGLPSPATDLKSGGGRELARLAAARNDSFAIISVSES